MRANLYEIQMEMRETEIGNSFEEILRNDDCALKQASNTLETTRVAMGYGKTE